MIHPTEPLKADNLHAHEPASNWVQRWSHLVKPEGAMLDVACGHGRHARWFHALNCQVTVVDRSLEAIEFLERQSNHYEAVVADIENAPWPFLGRQFDAVVVTNYLWRPLMPTLLDSLAPYGVLIYETFTHGNETIGKPSRPDFLLRPGELLEICKGLRVVAFEEGFLAGAHDQLPRFIQRIVAVRESSSETGESARSDNKRLNPPRYSLI